MHYTSSCVCVCVCTNRPCSLDAYVFGHLAPVLKSKLPNSKLQQHLKSLDNLSSFCSNILLLYFPQDGRGEVTAARRADMKTRLLDFRFG